MWEQLFLSHLQHLDNLHAISTMHIMLARNFGTCVQYDSCLHSAYQRMSNCPLTTSTKHTGARSHQHVWNPGHTSVKTVGQPSCEWLLISRQADLNLTCGIARAWPFGPARVTLLRLCHAYCRRPCTAAARHVVRLATYTQQLGYRHSHNRHRYCAESP